MVPPMRKEQMQDNTLLVKIIGLLFLAWFLYGILPYVIAGLSVCMFIFIVAKIKEKP